MSGHGWREEEFRYTGGRRADRFAVARLFQGASAGSREPRPEGRQTLSPRLDYRADAYRDAARVTHPAPVRFAMRPGLYYTLIGGSGVAALGLFFAGFLAAYLIFSDTEYPIAQAPLSAGDAATGVAATGTETSREDPSARALRRESESSDSTLTRAALAVGPETDLRNPSPEIAAVLDARRRSVREVDPALFDAQPPTSSSESAPGGVAAIMDPRPRLKPTPPARAAGSQPNTGTADGATERTARVQPGNTPTALASVTPQEPTRVIGGDAPYSLQFGAFGRRANAERMLRRLSSVLPEARIEVGTGADGQALHYVRAGGYETRLRADRALKDLRRESGLIGIVHAAHLEG